MEKAKYRDQISSIEAIPHVIDDLLGIRITCTNEIDVERLKEALAESVKTSDYEPGIPPTSMLSFSLERGSERDSRTVARPSGYRALHYNLLTMVPLASGGWETVRCELQIRTLLQDSWGELTHEDTYKPGADVSDLVETLSRRMADMFAVMDSLAQDLRTELDSVAASAAGDLLAPIETVHVEPSQVPADSADDVGLHDDPVSESDAQEVAAVQRYLRERYEGLSQPLHLASLAWELQGEFGSEITNGWLGYERMVDLLKASVPASAIVTGAPGLLVPAGFDAAGVTDSQEPASSLPDGIPAVARKIKPYDTDFPLLDQDTLSQAYSFLAEAHNAQRVQYGAPDLRYLNMVTRLARDLAADSGCSVGRNALNYIGRAVLVSGAMGGGLTHDMIAQAFTEFAVARIDSLTTGANPTAESDRQELRSWLRVLDGSGSEPPDTPA